MVKYGFPQVLMIRNYYAFHLNVQSNLFPTFSCITINGVSVSFCM